MHVSSYWFRGGVIALLMGAAIAYSEANIEKKEEVKPEPFRTFLNIQRFTIESNGESENPISNVRLELKFNKETENETIIKLPGGDQYWPIGDGQVQDIGQTFEVPWAFIQKDGFNFEMQIIRKGTRFLPCKFEVTQLSQFNRSYVCRSDINWQRKENYTEEELDREAVQIRIFTDKNSPKKEIPQEALAIRPTE